MKKRRRKRSRVKGTKIKVFLMVTGTILLLLSRLLQVNREDSHEKGILCQAEEIRESKASFVTEAGKEKEFLLPENARPELVVLVNRENPIADEYDPKLRKICNGRLEASEYLYEDLCAMLKAAGEAGYDFWIASAYRSVEYQEELIQKDILKYIGQGDSYESARAKSYEYKMPPGNSEHHTGLALDILCSTNLEMNESQAKEEGNIWLREHCSEYGFVLRYPEGREDITGVKFEPWHFRYVGKEVADFMTNHQLVLEDYVNLLEESGDTELFSK